MNALKYIVRAVVLLLAVVAMGGCSRPKTIPDQDLELIFKEIYMVNAFCDTHTVTTDSLDIYTPIMEKYGYTVKDMTYTIKGFTKRKSSRLSDIIDQAISQLEAEYKVYEGRVAVLDTVDVRAGELFKEVVYKDSILRATRVRDTVRLRIKLPVKKGSYKISYSTLLDTLELNTGLRVTHFVYDTAGHQTNYNTNWISVGPRKSFNTTLETTAADKKLVLVFGNYPKAMATPNMRIDSLVVTYYLPKEVARDSVTRILLDYKLLIDGKEYSQVATDSCARRIHPPRIIAKRDSVR